MVGIVLLAGTSWLDKHDGELVVVSLSGIPFDIHVG